MTVRHKSQVLTESFKPNPPRVPAVMSAAQKGGDALTAPQPIIPKPLAGQAITDDAVMAFTTGVLRLELTGPIVTVGGAPSLFVQEYEGTESRMAWDPATTVTATVPVISRVGAQAAHDSLIGFAAAGMVFRLYGPIVGAARQGDVYAFTQMPEPVVPDDGFDGRGQIVKWTCSIALTRWTPMGSVTVDPHSRVSPGESAGKATQRFIANKQNLGRFLNG